MILALKYTETSEGPATKKNKEMRRVIEHGSNGVLAKSGRSELVEHETHVQEAEEHCVPNAHIPHTVEAKCDQC